MLVISQLSAPDLTALIAHRRRAGRPTIFEINDDLSGAGDWLRHGEGARQQVLRAAVLNTARACDAVIYSSEGLRQRYAALHPRAFVLEPPVSVAATQRPQSGFVLGWGGTTSHRADLMAIAPVLADFLQANPRARFAFMGHAGAFADLLAMLPAAQVDLSPFADDAAWQHFLTGLHAGLAPLGDTRFNRARSDGKFAQYAAAGVVPVLADVLPYAAHREHACLYDTPQALRALLQRLHDDPGFRAERASAALGWVAVHRSPEAVRERMRQLFGSLLAGVAASGTDGAALIEPPWLAALTALREQAGQPDSLLAAADALLARWPECRTARCLAASVWQRRGEHEAVLRLAEAAPAAALAGDDLAALAYVSARRLDRSGADWLQRVNSPARRLRLAGCRDGDLPGHFRALLAHEPYDYFALFGLMHWLQRHGDPDGELPALIARAQLLAPDQLNDRESA